jgi:hypothetical protein
MRKQVCTRPKILGSREMAGPDACTVVLRGINAARSEGGGGAILCDRVGEFQLFRSGVSDVFEFQFRLLTRQMIFHYTISVL